jgi:Ca2+-binding EF-hand superfamily protein
MKRAITPVHVPDSVKKQIQDKLISAMGQRGSFVDAFKKYHKGRGLNIDVEEFRQIVNLRMKLGLDSREINSLFKLLDTDGNGTISFTELQKFCDLGAEYHAKSMGEQMADMDSTHERMNKVIEKANKTAQQSAQLLSENNADDINVVLRTKLESMSGVGGMNLFRNFQEHEDRAN